jgi:hypothetical protein
MKALDETQIELYNFYQKWFIVLKTCRCQI